MYLLKKYTNSERNICETYKHFIRLGKWTRDLKHSGRILYRGNKNARKE